MSTVFFEGWSCLVKKRRRIRCVVIYSHSLVECARAGKKKCILSFRISVAADVNSGVFLIALSVALQLKKKELVLSICCVWILITKSHSEGNYYFYKELVLRGFFSQSIINSNPFKTYSRWRQLVLLLFFLELKWSGFY